MLICYGIQHASSNVDHDNFLVPPKKLELEIPAPEYAKLFKMALIAKKAGIISEQEKKSVFGFIQTSAEKQKVKLRISGDLTDHIDLEEGIFSLDVDAENGIRGFTRFKLLLAETRPRSEFILSEAFRSLGYPSLLRSKVDVSLNGKSYKSLFVEMPNRMFFERHRLREFPVFKGDERPFWESALRRNRGLSPDYPNFSYFKSRGDFVGKFSFDTPEKINISKFNLSLNIISQVNYLALISKDPAHFSDKVFDTSVYYKFLSKYSPHSLLPNNLIFYYDFFRNRFHPIFYDSGGVVKLDPISDCELDEKGSSLAIMLVDKHEIVLTSGEECMVSDFYKQFHPWDGRGFVRDISEYGFDVKSADTTLVPQKMIGWIRPSDKKVFVCSTADPGSVLRGDITGCVNLSEKSVNVNGYHKLVKGKFRASGEAVPLIGIAGWLGGSENTIYWNSWTVDVVKCEVGLKCELSLKGPTTIELHETTRELEIKAVTENGRAIVAGANHKLDSIRLTGVNAQTSDVTKFPVITGCLTILDSRIYASSVEIKDSHCEDGLNVVGSYFEADKVTIQNSLSDGLDSDFSDLKIGDLNVNTTGNDCADFSWSRGYIETVLLKKCGDKGMSVGERSEIALDDGSISKALIGVAVKDASSLAVKQLTIDKISSCSEVYVKKPEFQYEGVIHGSINCK